MPPLRIDIVLDLICPWCFIGKRRLEQALARRPMIEPLYVWRPFQLNPDMPDDGMARHEYLASKYGGGQHAGRIYQTVADAGAAVGIPFAFDCIRRTPATRAAHRLVRHAGAEGRADTLVETLFRGYFIDGRDIGAHGVLVELAGEAGLDPADTRRFLASEHGAAETLAEERGARRIGINAVPCFIVAEQYAISGAQEPEFFLPVLDLALNGGAVTEVVHG
jgi:predicted DsbA family dithiol-disulfide isomerase